MLRVLVLWCLTALAAVEGYRIGRYAALKGSSALKAGGSNSEYDGILAGIRKSTPAGSVVVIKYGGHAMENEEAKKQFCEDIGALCRTGVLPVIVHGGGPQIAKMLANLKIESRFENGLRVTDAATMEVAQMVLCGSINKEIVGKISGQEGVRGAVGLCGLDSQLIKAKVKNPALGLVGEPSTVNTDIIKDLLALKLVPVIAPVGCNEQDGTALNINADTAAGAVAEALKADRLLLLTDIVGVLDKEKKLIETIPSAGPTSLKALTADGTITGGMIPKLETGVQAVEAGVKVVSIMDGRVKYCILRALSGEVFGTRIVK